MEVTTRELSEKKEELLERFTTQNVNLLSTILSDEEVANSHSELCWFLDAIERACKELSFLSKDIFSIYAQDRVFQLIEQMLSVFTMGFDINHLIALSGAVQESVESKDYFLVILPYEDCSKIKDQMLLEFSEVDCKYFDLNSIHKIRKQLNLTKGGSLAVCKDIHRNRFRTVGVLSKEATEQYPRFYFSKRLQWEFYLPKSKDNCRYCNYNRSERKCINSEKDEPCKNAQELQDCRYTDPRRACKLCRLRYAQGTLMMPLTDLSQVIFTMLEQHLKDKYDDISSKKYAELMTKIIKSTDNCDHGALIIFSDRDTIRAEANRLCHLERGVLLPSPMQLDDSNLNDLVRRMASIDGAALVDFDGKCYAYGVILDGEAVYSGSRDRGARFNSCRTYIDYRYKLQSEHHPNDNASQNDLVFIGVVKSEDGMLNLFWEVKDPRDVKSGYI